MENLLELIYEESRQKGPFLEDSLLEVLMEKKFIILSNDLLNKMFKKQSKERCDIDIAVIVNNQLILVQCKSITKRKRKTYLTKIREGRKQVYNALRIITSDEKNFKDLAMSNPFELIHPCEHS